MTRHAPLVAFSLQADERFLELVDSGVLAPDAFEIVPETLWRPDGSRTGALAPNGFFERILETGRRLGRPFLAHGVAYSPGSLGSGEARRKARWREALAWTREAFDWVHFSEHLGTTVLAGSQTLLPLPQPPGEATARAVRDDLDLLAPVVGPVGLENSSFPFALGDPLAQADLLAQATEGTGRFVVLDLENLAVDAWNLGFDAWAFLDRVPLERVREIHVAGGGTMGRPVARGPRRVDSHDGRVRSEVFELLARVAPRCPALEAVTLERMAGSVEGEDVAGLALDLERVRGALA